MLEMKRRLKRVTDRILVVQRARPELLAALLPEDAGGAGEGTTARPLVRAGFGFLIVCYTRRTRPIGGLGGIPGLRGRDEELALFVPCEDAASWRIGRPRRGLEVQLDSDERGVRLTVTSRGVELLHLAAEARVLLSGSVLATAREAGRLLAGSGDLEGARELVVPGDRALEPLEVLELRARLLEEYPAVADGELDSAFRLVERRTAPAAAPERGRLDPGPSVNPLPSS